MTRKLTDGRFTKMSPSRWESSERSLLCSQQNVCEYHNCSNKEVCPVGVNRSVPTGVQNVSCIQEGWSSILHWNGSQHRMATFVRTDGNAETAMGLAVCQCPPQPIDVTAWLSGFLSGHPFCLPARLPEIELVVDDATTVRRCSAPASGCYYE